MKLLFDFFPIILYVLGYYQADLLIEHTIIGQWIDPEKPDFVNATIIAVAIAIAASFAQVSYSWLKTRHVEKMHLYSFALIAILGGITIALGNPAFFQWKPTVLNWLFAAAFFISFFIGEKTLVERAMGKQIKLPDEIWSRLNIGWVLFFLFSGSANLYVAFYYQLGQDEHTRMDTWVNFKVFGLMGMTLIFIILQAIYLSRHMQEDEDATSETNKSPD